MFKLGVPILGICYGLQVINICSLMEFTMLKDESVGDGLEFERQGGEV